MSANYFHCSLYRFEEVAYKEVILRFNAAINDISVRCWYNVEIDMFEVKCPPALGVRADETLSGVLNEFALQELENASNEERLPNIRRFPESGFEEYDDEDDDEDNRSQPEDATLQHSEPATLHTVNSEAAPDALIKPFFVRDLPEALVTRSLGPTPDYHSARSIAMGLTCRTVRWDTRGQDYIFNGRCNEQIPQKGSTAEAAFLNMAAFHRIGDQPPGPTIRTGQPAPLPARQDNANFSEQVPGVAQWLQGVETSGQQTTFPVVNGHNRLPQSLPDQHSVLRSQQSTSPPQRRPSSPPNDPFPSYGRDFATVDEHGLTADPASTARWELANSTNSRRRQLQSVSEYSSYTRPSRVPTGSAPNSGATETVYDIPPAPVYPVSGPRGTAEANVQIYNQQASGSQPWRNNVIRSEAASHNLVDSSHPESPLGHAMQPPPGYPTHSSTTRAQAAPLLTQSPSSYPDLLDEDIEDIPSFSPGLSPTIARSRSNVPSSVTEVASLNPVLTEDMTYNHSNTVGEEIRLPVNDYTTSVEPTGSSSPESDTNVMHRSRAELAPPELGFGPGFRLPPGLPMPALRPQPAPRGTNFTRDAINEHLAPIQETVPTRSTMRQQARKKYKKPPAVFQKTAAKQNMQSGFPMAMATSSTAASNRAAVRQSPGPSQTHTLSSRNHEPEVNAISSSSESASDSGRSDDTELPKENLCRKRPSGLYHFEVQFGMALVWKNDKDFRKGVDKSQTLQSKLNDSKVPTEVDFVSKLTTSTSDACYVLDLAPDGMMYTTFSYSIRARDSEGRLFDLEFLPAVEDETGISAVTTLQDTYMHYPLRMWDAHVMLQRTATIPLEAKDFISSMRTEGDAPSFCATVPQGGFMVERAFAKRTYCKALHAGVLSVIEVQDLFLESIPALDSSTSRSNFRATWEPRAQMLEDKRLWWEAKLSFSKGPDSDDMSDESLRGIVDSLIFQMDGVGFHNKGPLMKRAAPEPRSSAASEVPFW